MGDLHFLLRHGLTGVIVFVFALGGAALYNFDPAHELPELHAASIVATLNSAPILALVSTAVLPVVGIVIQGMYILGAEVANKLFTDPARCVIQDFVRTKLDEEYPPGTTRPTHFDRVVGRVPDSPFVWLYYSSAPAHLVDWARRRRSYHFLGVTWGIAAILGLVAGVLYPIAVGAVSYARYGNALTWVVVIAATVIWVAAGWYLAMLMKRDVDDMEMAWAHWRASPKFQELVGSPK